MHVYHAAHIKRALLLGVKSIEHGQFIDKPTAKLLKKKGAFIAPFTTGFSPEALKHPVYGKVGTPQYEKAKEFQEDSKNFVAILKDVKPKIAFAIDVVFLTSVNARRQRDFEKWTFAEAFGNFEALKSMTSTAGELVPTSRLTCSPGVTDLSVLFIHPVCSHSSSDGRELTATPISAEYWRYARSRLNAIPIRSQRPLHRGSRESPPGSRRGPSRRPR